MSRTEWLLPLCDLPVLERRFAPLGHGVDFLASVLCVSFASAF